MTRLPFRSYSPRVVTRAGHLTPELEAATICHAGRDDGAPGLIGVSLVQAHPGPPPQDRHPSPASLEPTKDYGHPHYPRRHGSIFNVGGGQEIKLLDAIAIRARRLDVDPLNEHAESRRGDQRRTAAEVLFRATGAPRPARGRDLGGTLAG